MEVLLIDYLSNSASKELVKSIRETGFAVIENHPIDRSLIDSVYNEWAEFFNSSKKNWWEILFS